MGSRSAGLINLEGSGGHRRLVSPQEMSQILRLPAGWPLARSLSLKFLSFFPLRCSSFTRGPFSLVTEQEVQRRTTLGSLIWTKKKNNHDSWCQWNKTTVNYWDNQTTRQECLTTLFISSGHIIHSFTRRGRRRRRSLDTDHIHWDGVHHSILDANVSGLGITRINSFTFVPGTTCFWSSPRLVMRFPNPGRHQIKPTLCFYEASWRKANWRLVEG